MRAGAWISRRQRSVAPMAPSDCSGVVLGEARVRALDRQLLLAAEPSPTASSSTAAAIATLDAELTLWAQGFRAEGMLGLALAGIPREDREALSWVGMPFAQVSPVRWGEQVRYDLPRPGGAPATAPRLHQGQLMVPSAAALRACSAVALRPLRAFIHQHWGCRLQAAAGLHAYYWAERVLLVSTREVPLAGFLHGPRGRRAAIRMAPGEAVVTSW
jgi:hypothetical protein